MSLLEVGQLTVTTGHTPLVRALDLTIDPGERVGLIGESGSGKSLTCLSILGLLPDNLRASGSLRLDGVNGNLLTAGERTWSGLRGKRLSMIFQEPMTALNPLMRVGKQVGEVMVLHGSPPAEAQRRTLELLDQVGLPDPDTAARAYPHQLSGGQRQRVMLSMAMANSPDLLLADEPTTALDVTVQSQVLDLMRRQVHDHHTALLFITHDLAVVSGMCERVLIMRDGQLLEAGTIDRVFSAPEHPYTRGLLAASALSTDPRTGKLITVPQARPGSVEDPEELGTEERSAAPVSKPDQLQPPTTPTTTTPSEKSAEADAEHQVLEDDPELIFHPVPDPLISVRNLTRTYLRGRTSLFGPRREVQGLRGVSFDVAAGDRLGIVGESGSGKSTLLRLLCGLDSATAGSAAVSGLQLVGARERDLRPLRDQVQIVFQDPHSSLDPRMRVQDVVSEPLRGVSDQTRRRQVAEILEAVGLPADAATRFPHQFSGGQRQRIAIARALITDPRILLADEAVSALDVSVRAQVLNLLADLVDRYRLTLIFVSHDLNVIRHLCSTVAVMQSGRIVECGPTQQVYADARHPYTRQLINALPQLQQEVHP